MQMKHHLHQKYDSEQSYRCIKFPLADSVYTLPQVVGSIHLNPTFPAHPSSMMERMNRRIVLTAACTSGSRFITDPPSGHLPQASYSPDTLPPTSNTPLPSSGLCFSFKIDTSTGRELYCSNYTAKGLNFRYNAVRTIEIFVLMTL